MFPSPQLAQQTALQELKTSSAGYSHVNQRMAKEVHDSLTTVWEEWTEQFGYPGRPGPRQHRPQVPVDAVAV